MPSSLPLLSKGDNGLDLQVLLHLLRAGYFLQNTDKSCSNGDVADFAIRTIYFESSSAFPEINSFTYDTAKMWEMQTYPFFSSQ